MIHLIGLYGSGNAARGILTVGESFGGRIGFDAQEPAGSITGEGLGVPGFSGTSVLLLYSESPNFDVWLGVTGFDSDPGASILTKLIVEDGDGTVREYLTSSASYLYSAASDSAIWRWGDGSDPIYDSGDLAETHPYVVF